MANAVRSVCLITTRLRAAVALGLTAYVFALSVRDEVHPAHTKPTSLFGAPHGWLAIVVSIAFYGYLCWLSFRSLSLIKGRERLFFVGWFGFLLSPVKIIRPEWAALVEDLQFFGITVSLIAALSLLMYPSAADPDSALTQPEL